MITLSPLEPSALSSLLLCGGKLGKYYRCSVIFEALYTGNVWVTDGQSGKLRKKATAHGCACIFNLKMLIQGMQGAT